MDDIRTFPSQDARPPVDLAITGWLALHQGSPRTSAAYADTITKFRAELVRLGEDVDSDVRTLAIVAHAFATSTSHPGKDRASPATINTRLAILSSFYEYALSRYLLAPMDNAGHILNPIKIVKREKIDPYHAIHWLL